MTDKRAAYFDEIAPKWDGWQDRSAEGLSRLREGLRALGLGGDQSILEVGCGTGNLTLLLLEALSPSGRVLAVDLSETMIALARPKNADPRVTWRVADIAAMPLEAERFDSVVCYSVWPHLEAPRSTGERLFRALRRGGTLHVWHSSSRAKVNDIHAHGGPAIHHDILLPARTTADTLEAVGFEVLEIVDDEERYLVTARKRLP